MLVRPDVGWYTKSLTAPPALLPIIGCQRLREALIFYPLAHQGDHVMVCRHHFSHRAPAPLFPAFLHKVCKFPGSTVLRIPRPFIGDELPISEQFVVLPAGFRKVVKVKVGGEVAGVVSQG